MMSLFSRLAALSLAAAATFPAATPDTRAAAQPPDFKEVFDLIQSQLPDLEEGSLSQAAARGLIRELEPRVQLLTDTSPGQATSSIATVGKSVVLDNAYAYMRLEQVGPEGPEAFKTAWQNLASVSGKFKGLILDLRFAAGEDYKAAAKLADQFFAAKEPLVDWGKGLEYSEAKSNAIDLPLALLINRQTAGSAEALAGILRYGTAALLIGSPTAGKASVYRDFTLTTGQRLRIAVQSVMVGKDRIAITSRGLKPDLAVNVPPEGEKVWLDDPYKILPLAEAPLKNATADSAQAESPGSPTSRRRINEADLVRMLREGEYHPLGIDSEARSGPSSGKVIQDPVLARALDFLKGLAVVRQFQAK